VPKRPDAQTRHAAFFFLPFILLLCNLF
jgi:hypothetical protein